METEQIQALAVEEEVLAEAEAEVLSDKLSVVDDSTLNLGDQQDDEELLLAGSPESLALSSELERRTFIASDETVVERFYGRLILGHKRSEVRLSRQSSNAGIPWLEYHDHRELRGRAVSSKLRKSQLQVEGALSSTPEAQRMAMQIDEGVLPGISVGAMIYRMKLIEEDANDPWNDLYRAVDWEPLEYSSVSIPANPNVGISNFAIQGTGEETMTQRHNVAPFHSMDPRAEFQAAVDAKVEHQMEQLKSQGSGAPDNPQESGQHQEEQEETEEEALAEMTQNTQQSGTTAPELTEAQAVTEAQPEVTAAAEQTTEPAEEVTTVGESTVLTVADQILGMGKRLGYEEQAKDAIIAGQSYEDFLQGLAETREKEQAPEHRKVYAEPRTTRYNLSNIFRTLLEPDNESLAEKAAYEMKVSSDLRSLEERNRIGGRSSGFIVPLSAFLTQNSNDAIEEFAVSSSEAAEMIRTDVAEVQLPFQEASPVLGACRIVTGLVGDLSIPVIGRAQPTDVAEGNTNTPTDPTVTGPKLTPKTADVAVDLTNLSIHQSDGTLETAVMAEVMDEWGFKHDTDIVAGTGTGNAVRGIVHTTGAGSVTPSAGAHVDGTSMTWKDMLALVRTVAKTRKVLPDGRVPGGRYILPPELDEVAQYTLKDNNRRMFIREDGGPIGRYEVIVTNAVPYAAVTGSNNDNKYAIFGDLMEVWVGFWGDVNIYRNQLTNPGRTIITWQIWRDVQIARPGALAFAHYDGGS